MNDFAASWKAFDYAVPGVGTCSAARVDTKEVAAHFNENEKIGSPPKCPHLMEWAAKISLDLCIEWLYKEEDPLGAVVGWAKSGNVIFELVMDGVDSLVISVPAQYAPSCDLCSLMNTILGSPMKVNAAGSKGMN